MLSTTARTLRTASRTMMASRASAAAPSSITTHHQYQQQQRRNYHENIVEHYENPRNVGSLDKNSDDVGTVSFYYYLLIMSVLWCITFCAVRGAWGGISLDM